MQPHLGASNVSLAYCVPRSPMTTLDQSALLRVRVDSDWSEPRFTRVTPASTKVLAFLSRGATHEVTLGEEGGREIDDDEK